MTRADMARAVEDEAMEMLMHAEYSLKPREFAVVRMSVGAFIRGLRALPGWPPIAREAEPPGDDPDVAPRPTSTGDEE